MAGTRETAGFRREHLRSFGRRLRQLREARSWSLKRLASESGLSIAAIQKIESGEANPSLLTVLAVAEVLGEPVDRLIGDSRQAGRAVKVVRGTLAQRGARIQHLSSELAEPRVDSRLVVLSAREALKAAVLPESGSVFAYVMDGALKVTFADGASRELAVGDALHASKPLPTVWSNPLSRRSVILCISDRREAATGFVQETA
jgi:transcriptional regulator with XRE-family HTH domain